MITIKKRRLFYFGILLLFVGGIVLLFGIFQRKKAYRQIDFTRELAALPSLEISGFNPTEGWKGDVTYENGLVQEGEYSLTFVSLSGKKNIATLERSIPTDGFGRIHLQYYIKDTASAPIAFRLSLQNKKKSYTYAITPTSPGWHVFTIEKNPSWAMLTGVSLEIESSQGGVAQVQLDRLWLSSGNIPDSIMNVSKSQPPLYIKSQGTRTYLYLTSLTQKPHVYTLSKQLPQNPSQLTVGFIPERTGMFGVSVGGYTFRIAGAGMSSCSIERYPDKHAVLAEKKLTTSTAGKGLYSFMRILHEGDVLSALISNNDVDYELCASVPVKRLGSQPITFEVQGSYLVDSLSIEY